MSQSDYIHKLLYLIKKKLFSNIFHANTEKISTNKNELIKLICELSNIKIGLNSCIPIIKIGKINVIIEKTIIIIVKQLN